MAHVDSINIHHAEDCVAKATCSEGTCWLSLEFSEDDGQRVRRFRVAVFMDYARASRVATAINEAWPEPVQEADPVITWERPSYHKQAVGMRCEDAYASMPKAVLNGDDPEAA